LKRTRVPWSEVLNDARAASSRATPAQSLVSDDDLGDGVPRERLRRVARDALRSAYEGLDGLVLDLDLDDDDE
jgi:hypothetical protein